MSRSVEVRLRANVSQFNSGMFSAQRAVHQSVGGMVNAMAGVERKQRQVTDSVKAGWTEATGAIRKHSTEVDRVGTGMMKAGALIGLGLGASAKAAMSWESAFAGVRKTVDELDPAFGALEGQLRHLARTMATSHEDIAAVAENAGALGVKTKDIAAFTRQMIILGETTNVTADDASTYMAQLMTIMGTAPNKVGNLAAALVDLGNNGASTEAQILEMSQRIAGAGRAVGMTEAQVMGFASAIASTGINVEAGGSAISRVFTNLDRIVTNGGAKLETLNELVGGDFATAFKQDASGAVVTFIEKLGRLQEQGGSITGVLDDLGIKQIYQTDVIRRLAGAHGLLAEQLGISEQATRDGTAALEEYGKRMETTESRAAVAWNNIKDAGIEFGNEMLPIIADAADGLSELMQTFQDLPGPVKAVAVQLAGVTAAALLLGGGALKAVVWGVKMVDTFRALEKTAPRTAAGIKKAAVAAALFSAAAAAAHAAGAAWDEEAERARTKGTDIAVNLAKGLQTGAKNIDFGSLLKDKWGQYSGGDALRRIYDPNFSERLNTFLSGAIFGTDVGKQMREQIGEIDSAFAMLAQSGNAEAAADGFRQFEQFVTNSGQDMAQVIPDMKEYRQALDQVADGLGLSGQLEESDFVEWMRGTMPDAVREAVAANDGLTNSLTDQQKALLGVSDAAEDAVRTMREYSALALALSGSSLGVQMAFDQIMEKGTYDKKTGQTSGGIIRGGGFSETTKKGQHNLEQIQTAAAAVQAKIDDLVASGADMSKLTTETDKWRDALAKAYELGGKTADVAAVMAAELISIPTEVAPTFSAPGAVVTKQQAEDLEDVLRQFPSEAETDILVSGARPSKQEVSDFIDTVHDMPDEVLTRIKTIAELAGVDAAQEALGRLRDKTVTVRTKHVNTAVADGGLFTRHSHYTGPLMRAYADSGTTALPAIGSQQPRIEHNRGQRGIQWSETGAGPWEGFVSGHPQKRRRSRAVTEDIADRLGGDIVWRAAGGGMLTLGRPTGTPGGSLAATNPTTTSTSMPTYKGKPLDYWEDKLLTPLELTRLKIRIRNLEKDLKATEKYGKGKKKKTRKKLRGLDRKEATLELAELKQDLADAQTAAAANKSKSGTLAKRIEQYETAKETAQERADQATKAVEDAWTAASSTVSGWAGFAGFDTNPTKHTNAGGDIWYTPTTGASYASQLKKHADDSNAFRGKLDALRRAGASEALVEAVQQEASRDIASGIAMADAFLTDRAALQSANSSYARLDATTAKATAGAVAARAVPVSAGVGGVLAAGSVRATIADGEMARALAGVKLTLMVEGKPISAIIQQENAKSAASLRNATGGW